MAATRSSSTSARLASPSCPSALNSRGRTDHRSEIYSDAASSFALITGPNMAGKTTYLAQIALTVVLAQVRRRNGRY